MFQFIATIKLILLILLMSVQPQSLSANDQTDGVRPSIMRLCDKLERGRIVHLGARVGYANKVESSNRYFKAYKRLRRAATEAELVELCKSESKVILTYSFAALIYKESSAARVVFERHLQDTSMVWLSGGCTGVLTYLNSFMLTSLMPQPGATVSLMSKEEYDTYLEMLAGSYH